MQYSTDTAAHMLGRTEREIRQAIETGALRTSGRGMVDGRELRTWDLWLRVDAAVASFEDAELVDDAAEVVA
jgi:hypothetical protein